MIELKNSIVFYCEYMEAHGLSEETIKLYSSQVKFSINNNAFDSLTKFHIFLNKRRKKLAKKSFNTLIGSLNSFSKFLRLYDDEIDVSMKILDEINNIKTYTDPDPVRDLIAYSPEQMDLIMSSKMNAWRWQFLWTAANFGLRAGELRKLNLDDIDFDNKWIKIRAEIAKSKKVRYIPISRSQERILKNWVKLRQGSKYYLCTRYKSVEKRVSKRSASYWDPQSREINLKVGAHNMRYTFATRLYNLTKDIFMVQKLLGHSSPKITMKYLKITIDDFLLKYREMDFRVF